MAYIISNSIVLSNNTITTISGINLATSANMFTNGTIGNLEEIPKTIRYGTKFETTSASGVAESTAIYIRVDPTGVQNMATAFYMEVTSGQQDTEAGAFKCIHFGSGDAMYIACFGNGPALEAASFYNGSRGFIATNQITTASGTDFGNTTLFNAVWGWDGTGGSTTPANYGIFYAARSLGNAFRVRLQDSGATGFAWGRPEIQVSNFDFTRDMVQIYNTGLLRLSSYLIATAGGPLQAAPAIQLYGSFWNGASAVNKSIVLQPSLDGAGGPILYIQMGTAGGESTPFIFYESGNVSFAGNTLRLVTRRTISASNDPGNDGDFCFDSSYFYVCVGASNWKRIPLTW